MATARHNRTLPQDIDKLVVTQDNELAGSIQDMNLVEKRNVLLSAAVIRTADTHLPSVRFYTTDYRRIFGVKNKTLTQDFLDIVDTITTRNVVLPHGRKGKTSFSVVSTYTVVPGPDSEDGRAYVEMKLHDDMAGFFLNLERNFLSLPLLLYSSFRSNYALRLSEILASAGRGEKQFTVTFSVNDLKAKLNCEHYSNFAQFRRRALEPAKKENDEIGYLSFEWDEHKRGRSISDLSFHVRLSETWSAERERGDIERIALDNRLRQLGFNTIPYEYYEFLGKERVEALVGETLKQVRRREQTTDKIKKPGAYLRKILDAEVERARGMLPFSAEAEGEGGQGLRTIDTAQELYSLAERLCECFYRARQEHAEAVIEALESEEREELTALMLKDIFSGAPTLVAPVQVPETAENLLPQTRRLALVVLLERQGRVTYEGDLKNIRAFAYANDLFSEFLPAERDRIIGEAQTANA